MVLMVKMRISSGFVLFEDFVVVFGFGDDGLVVFGVFDEEGVGVFCVCG